MTAAPTKPNALAKAKTTRTKKVPTAALRFNLPIEFGQAEEADGKTEMPITLLARAAAAIQHPYWGKIEHDMEGMELRKETCPIDWCHWARYGSGGDIIGVADEFDANPKKGLTIKGKLVSVMAEDRADFVMKQGKAGIPFEASIDFNGPMRLEEVGEGMTAQVNGHKFTGPGTIVREWTLTSVAVCPYGADPNTKSKFAAGMPAGDEEVEVTLFSEPDPMSKDAPATEPAEGQELTNPAPTTAPASPPATDPKAAFKATLDKYVAEFGAANGAQWAADGLSYEDALKKHAGELAAKAKADGDAKDAKIADLEAKLAAIPRGEATPTSLSDAGKSAPAGHAADVTALSAKLGDNLAKVAGAIKLPGGKA